jgi:predicted nucleic acid-binding protein
MAADLILLDTCVFIKAFRKDKEALKIITDFKSRAAYSDITRLELLFGAATIAKKNAVNSILATYYSISLSPAISKMAVKIMEKHISGQRSISIPDCLIAATSIVTGFKLLTFNNKDFNFIDDIDLFNYKDES